MAIWKNALFIILGVVLGVSVTWHAMGGSPQTLQEMKVRGHMIGPPAAW